MTVPSKPQGMSDLVWRAIGKLRGEVRDRVLERSAIKAASGTPWQQADREALQEEANIDWTTFGDEVDDAK